MSRQPEGRIHIGRQSLISGGDAPFTPRAAEGDERQAMPGSPERRGRYARNAEYSGEDRYSRDVEPPQEEPPYNNARYSGPRFGETRREEPRYGEPSYDAPRRGSRRSYSGRDGSRRADARYEGSRYGEPRLGNARYDEPRAGRSSYRETPYVNDAPSRRYRTSSDTSVWAESRNTRTRRAARQGTAHDARRTMERHETQSRRTPNRNTVYNTGGGLEEEEMFQAVAAGDHLNRGGRRDGHNALGGINAHGSWHSSSGSTHPALREHHRNNLLGIVLPAVIVILLIVAIALGIHGCVSG